MCLREKEVCVKRRHEQYHAQGTEKEKKSLVVGSGDRIPRAAQVWRNHSIVVLVAIRGFCVGE